MGGIFILAENGQKYIIQLEKLVDEDTNAFNNIINAFRLADTTEKKKNTKMLKYKSHLICYRIP